MFSVCVCVCVCLCLCTGRGLATSWSPVQRVLPTVPDQETEETQPYAPKAGASSQVWEQRGRKKILSAPLFWTLLFFAQLSFFRHGMVMCGWQPVSTATLLLGLPQKGSNVLKLYTFFFQSILLQNLIYLLLNITLYSTTNSGALVRKQTIPTERPPLVGEVSANFSG
jgi:hypothetical protein